MADSPSGQRIIAEFGVSAGRGYAIESHLKHIGMIKPEAMTVHQKKFLDEKRREFEAQHGESEGGAFPDKAVLCNKCSTKAIVLMDDCMTCLNCGESKCR